MLYTPKRCPGCGEVKPREEFPIDRSKTSGRKSRCGACQQRRKMTKPGRVATNRALVRRWGEENPLALRAHRIVASMVRSGMMLRPATCEVAGCSKRPHAHHPDYARPLHVVWLCASHHRKLHMSEGLMKCPKCRREIPLEAVRHDVCGWAVSSGGVNVAVMNEPAQPPAEREVIDAALERMRGIVHRAYRLPEPMRDRRRVQPPLLRDVGHGSLCTCAQCYAARMPGAKKDEEIKLTRNLRLEALRALFPVEG